MLFAETPFYRRDLSTGGTPGPVPMDAEEPQSPMDVEGQLDSMNLIQLLSSQPLPILNTATRLSFLKC